MYLEKFSLAGKVAVVTGGGRGLGKQMCLAMAMHGADIVAAARSIGQIEETAKEVRDLGRRAIAVPTDVTDSKACNALIDAAIAELGQIDIMMNNAGIGDRRGGPTELTEYTDEDWHYTLDVNLSGTFYCSRAASKRMIERGAGGVIINTSSGTGLRGNTGGWAYGTAKAGVIAFTKSLAVILAKDNIRANAIVPGFVSTLPPRNEQEAEFRRARGRYMPVKRLGEAWELGALAVYLASDASSYVTGESFIIDGGGLAGGYATTGFAPTVGL